APDRRHREQEQVGFAETVMYGGTCHFWRFCCGSYLGSGYSFSHRRKLAAEGAARLLCCMHISFAVFADAANLSQEGKLNVLGVFDAVQVAGLPTIHPRTHFIVRLKANGDDVGTHKLTFRSLSPLDEEL